MERKKLKLSFVNDGKPFRIPDLNVKKHEEFLEEMEEKEEEMKDMKKGKAGRLQQRLLILKNLQVVDESVSMEDILEMHPLDYEKVAEEVNNAFFEGGEMSDDGENFRKTKKEKKEK